MNRDWINPCTSDPADCSKQDEEGGGEEGRRGGGGEEEERHVVSFNAPALIARLDDLDGVPTAAPVDFA